MFRPVHLFAFLIGLAITAPLWGQQPEVMHSGDIHRGIKKLGFLGSALYVAAHPDDENTRLISYLSNEVHAATAYLSLTRGDGGQNLIGPEIRELLGLIRTQELLAARRTDGGSQFFTRANDFGYSKHPDETFQIWDRKQVLGDVVWCIRQWRPDIIVNRFDHRTPGRTHGHHTASAILSVEAFQLAGDPKAYPDQLQYVEPWQPERIFFNTSWWFYGSREAFAKADKSNMVSVDAGTYYPLRGLSNNEIAARSRSMHKSQGFGSGGRRGSDMEYLELVDGSMSGEPENLFAGVNTTWTRVPGGATVGKLVDQLEADFKHDQPAASVPQLLEIYGIIRALPKGYWRDKKLEETKQLIAACLGLYLETVAEESAVVPGDPIELASEVVNRSDIPVILKRIQVPAVGVDSVYNLPLESNRSYQWYRTVGIPEDLPYTTPYWLREQGSLGMYKVSDPRLIGMPETPEPLIVQYEVEVGGRSLVYENPVVYKYTDPVDGEVYRPFEIIPPVTLNIETDISIFSDSAPQEIVVTVQAGRPRVEADVIVEAPEGWQVTPASNPVSLDMEGEEAKVTFTVRPPDRQSTGQLQALATMDGKSYRQSIQRIEYDHIPTQTVLKDARSKVVRIDLQKAGERVGYIMGAGDNIPANLEQIGYQVDLLDPERLTLEDLEVYDAVITGVRAYNTLERMRFIQPILMEYVKGGGTMIVQYNTTRGLKIDDADMGPYPLELSRDRVTVEDAEVRFLEPQHPVLNFPNKITQADFEGWVQERGLYFPDEWDDRYQAILSSNDPGESPKDGGLLVAAYGKGYYIYTGYSWFRELPAGVPGAYRLFTNLISINQNGKN